MRNNHWIANWWRGLLLNWICCIHILNL
uniref:Uncharacterized protein n=1 Tax=Arundo donax TaxID=35708 RepID=A0A0A9BDE1_ARUDO